jgi:signal transduction histidine kinase
VSAPASAYAAIDADACMHALLNLLENAIKFGLEGGSIAVGCACDDGYVRITVDDDGPGIPADIGDRIFRLGVRGAKARPGSGIGLAVVKALVERSGGTVTASASPLGGARFVLQLRPLLATHPSV